jgi:hypothetical protein
MIRSLFAEQKRDSNAFGRGLFDLAFHKDTLEAEVAAIGLAEALNALRGKE